MAPSSGCLMILAIICATVALVVVSASRDDVNEYAYLIADLQDYLAITGVIVLYDGNDSVFVGQLVRQLSRRHQRYSIGLRMSSGLATDNLESLANGSSKLLFVVFLRTEEDLVGLARYGLRINKLCQFHACLVVFAAPMRAYCEEPWDNRLALDFGAEVLVRCAGGGGRGIREWFAVGAGARVQVHEYLEWSVADRLVVKSHPVLYERRRNLSGVTARTATIEAAKPRERNRRAARDDLVPRIVSELASVMNVTLNYQPSSFTYGSLNKTKRKWTGILGRLLNNSLDVAAAEMIINRDRGEVFDLTVPIIVSRTKLFIRMPDNTDVPWNAYLKTFNKKVWMGLVVVILVSLFVLTCIRVIIANVKTARHDHYGYLILDNYMHVWGIYCQQGLPDGSETTLPLKLAYFSIFLSAYLLTSAYSGSLTSYVTVSMPAMPFTDLIGFINDRSYKLIVLKNSAEHDVFLNPNDDVYYRMSLLLDSYENLPSSYIKGFEQVCSQKTAFFASVAMLSKVRGATPCELAGVPGGRVRKMGIGLRKHDPLTEFFNHYIRRFEENGVMSKLVSHYEEKFTRPKAPFDAFNVRDVMPLFAIWICGLIASAVGVLLECLYHKLGRDESRIIQTERYLLAPYREYGKFHSEESKRVRRHAKKCFWCKQAG
ncbi:glutamate receptor ionotropic, NMDA 2C-like [Copidosoma floridanum]|uniref:glutamate receptor ionotropic, NMDA 2C-like n=1 Tax=Copidosoma floridanum TaxID=29053 RepID=UPI0006C9BD2B|nr:glutamate receptor ionotropic, NMDA 2C-like [Copidosoma floridanum]